MGAILLLCFGLEGFAEGREACSFFADEIWVTRMDFGDASVAGAVTFSCAVVVAKDDGASVGGVMMIWGIGRSGGDVFLLLRHDAGGFVEGE